MPVTKDQKSEILKNLLEEMKLAKSVVFADFQGLSVKDMSNLRKEMKKKNVEYRIAKKTLIRLAARDIGYDDIPSAALEGPVGVALSMEDSLAAAKIVYQFAKKNQNLKLRGALFEGKVLSAKEASELALLPSRDELIAKFLYLAKYPIQGFHGVLHNTLAGFVRVVNGIKEKKEQIA